jgi:hypothetical protein
MKPSYTVTRVEPAAAREALTRLWGDNLTVTGGVDRKFDWLYVDAPEPPEVVFLLAVEQGGPRRWVGTAGVGLRRVQVGDAELRAGLLADLAVDREHRSLLPALSLVRAVKAWTLGELDLAYGFPNALAAGVFQRAGYRRLGTIGRWARVLRHAPYASRVAEVRLPGLPPAFKQVVDRAAAIGAVAAVAGGAVDVARLAGQAPAALQAARRVRLDWLAVPDERIDRLWEEARAAYDVVGVRSARLLAWRFPAADRLRVVLATARDGGAPLAYAVVEMAEGVAHLRDLFGHRAGVAALLDRLVPALYRRGATTASIRYLGAPWLAEALVARGWVARSADRLITIGVAEGLDARVAAAVTAAERWHLTDADEDT